ncbi:hypothetical protein J4E93_004981 [Alternaria ventricosa]|uniref:uncharacterized protein n=1 Tax=Alternaria ventricosa TaxID=1187951 RepID=UPI0020C21900|nr:uncharacterized protein J4E93_004981 [Alternaria ventricosa]KAI4646758.1 hypothetical protein J4E93_004981 [Alternaria ventricosa]
MSSNVREGRVVKTKETKKFRSSKQGDKTKTKSRVIRCRFLELPAEIRNRIYHFAEEKVYNEWLAPPLLVCEKLAGRVANPGSSSRLGTLRYRALTQVCKQIRTEYRPIWLRQSCFHMELSAVDRFVHTYYPKATSYQNAPRLLLISWDHGQIEGEFGEDYDGEGHSDCYEDSMQDVRSDITLLIRLRAHCPSFTAKFVSRRILEHDVRNLHCEECGHNLNCPCDTSCDHEDTWDEATWQMEDSYQYLRSLNAFLANSNENWLKLLRGKDWMNTLVEFSFNITTQRPTFYIRFDKGRAPKGFQLKNMYSYALKFLTRSGMLELEDYQLMEYVIGEETGGFTRNSREFGVLEPTYNQIHLNDSTIILWKKEEEAKTSAS